MLVLLRYLTDASFWPGDFLHPTGEWAARLMVAALMVTPVTMLFPGRRWSHWLLRNRRAFGVAAFGYTLLHLVFYILDMETLDNVLAEIGALGIWTGWLALFALVPMALTSNDAAMRLLRASWKRLQRLAYPAAVLTLVHWMFIHDGIAPALLTFAPLAGLEIYRLFRTTARRGPIATIL